MDITGSYMTQSAQATDQDPVTANLACSACYFNEQYNTTLKIARHLKNEILLPLAHVWLFCV